MSSKQKTVAKSESADRPNILSTVAQYFGSFLLLAAITLMAFYNLEEAATSTIVAVTGGLAVVGLVVAFVLKRIGWEIPSGVLSLYTVIMGAAAVGTGLAEYSSLADENVFRAAAFTVLALSGVLVAFFRQPLLFLAMVISGISLGGSFYFEGTGSVDQFQLIVGGITLSIAVILDILQPKKGYAVWAYLIGGLALVFGLTGIYTFDHFAIGLTGLAFLVWGGLRSRGLLIFGGGALIWSYLSYLGYSVFGIGNAFFIFLFVLGALTLALVFGWKKITGDKKAKK